MSEVKVIGLGAPQVTVRCRMVADAADVIQYVVVDLLEFVGNFERRTSLVFEEGEWEDTTMLEYTSSNREPYT